MLAPSAWNNFQPWRPSRFDYIVEPHRDCAMPREAEACGEGDLIPLLLAESQINPWGRLSKGGFKGWGRLKFEPVLGIAICS